MSYSYEENRTINAELGYLAELIFKQSVEIMAWFMLAAYSKMQEEGDKLREEQLSKTKQHKTMQDLVNDKLHLFFKYTSSLHSSFFHKALLLTYVQSTRLDAIRGIDI